MPSDAFPLPTWTPAYKDIFDGALVVADEMALPRDLMLGLCFAESGEGLQSFDRWHRWTTEAMTYIERGDRQGLLDILQRCAAVPTNDISFGPGHQSWRWSKEYNGKPYDLDAILAFRKRYIEDHGHALRVARDQIAGFWAKHGPDKVETLSRYNKPDGTATASVRKRYADMLALAQTKLGTPAPSPAPPSGIVYEDYRDPEPAGRFSKPPKGVILHGSRSGVAGNPIDKEYLGTARYEQTNPLGLGWHATIGERKVAVHLTPQEWGHNARAASDDYIGVEIAQATVDTPITDGQVEALADYLKTRIFPVWGDLGMHFPTHAELEAWGETGQKDGKTDIFPLGDARVDGVRNRLYALLAAPPAPTPVPTPPPTPPPPPAPAPDTRMTRALAKIKEAQAILEEAYPI